MADDLPRETYDSTDPAAEANAKRDEARSRREDADTYRLIMHTKPGRAWLHRRMVECHIFGQTFMPGQPDVTAFQLGEENIGKRWMVSAMAASPDLYMRMIKEQQDEELRLDEVRRREQRSREHSEAPPNPEDMVSVHLPPPAGYPGGPALPKRPDPTKR